MTGRLPRVLGPAAAALLCAGWTIGSGIFRVPSEVAAGAGSAGGALALWAFGGLFALCGAVCYAELGVRLPRSGAEFVYLEAAFGKGPAFLCGCAYLLSSPATLAAVARTFADYAGVLIPLQEPSRRLLAAGLIAGLTMLAARSTRGGSGVVGASTVAKLAAIAVVVAAALAVAPVIRPAMAPAAPPAGAAPPAIAALALAFAGIIFAYDGFQSVMLMGGEVRDPERNLPWAILLGTGVVTAVYLALNLSYFRVLGFEGVRGSEAVAADTVAVLIGAAGSIVVAGLVMISTLGSAMAQLLGNPRVIFAMAEEGLFFRPFAILGRATATPWVAIGLMGTLAIGLVLAGGYGFLIRVAVLTSYPMSALTMIGIPRLRRRQAVPAGFRMPLYPLPIVLYVATILSVWILSLVGDPPAALCGILLFAAGTVVYLRWRPRAATTGFRGGAS